MTKRAFLIHGWEGSPKKQWFPWLQEQLEKSGFKVFVPAMPNTMHPKMSEWLQTLAKSIGKPDEECYFVGHSLGCVTILRYLETLKLKQKIGGVVFIAGFSDDLGFKELRNFFTKPIEWEKIIRHCKKFVAIHGDKDKWVPLKHAQIFAEKLNADVVIKPGSGHFGDLGMKVFPEALEFTLKMSE